jgi:hypothetical protein
MVTILPLKKLIVSGLPLETLEEARLAPTA